MKKILYSAVLAFLATPLFASAAVVYDAIPAPLDSSYPSQPFQAQQVNEFGDYVHLGGTERDLKTVSVTMVDWAVESTPANVLFCTNNPGACDSTGFDWPITVNIYNDHLDVNGVPDTLIATKTLTQHILWRPADNLDKCPGDSAWYDGAQCRHGYAFNLSFDMSDLGVTLPDDVIVSFVYNTQSYGPLPTGVDGPYNSLNIAVPTANVASVGHDDSADEAFWNTSNKAWYTNPACPGNTFCKDTNWVENGTIAMKIEAVTPPPAMVKIQIFKYVDGALATAAGTNSAVFPMLTTFSSPNLGSVTDVPFTLSSSPWGGIGIAYEADFIGSVAGADYIAHEVTTGNDTVGASCSDGKPYALDGYSVGATVVDAESAAKTLTAPQFTNLQNDQVMIVWNKTCTSAPTITSPANNICTTSSGQQLIDWTDSTGVAPMLYQYQAYSDSSYSSLVYDSGMTLSASQIATPGTPDGTYYVRVRAQGANGTISDWSNGASNPFKIIVSSTFTVSALLSPLNISGKTFNTGSTIPVKVQIANACGLVSGTGVPSLTISGPTSSSGPFRYDAAAGQYIFNWATTKGKTGNYTITVGQGTTGATGPYPSTIVTLVK